MKIKNSSVGFILLSCLKPFFYYFCALLPAMCYEKEKSREISINLVLTFRQWKLRFVYMQWLKIDTNRI